MLGVCAVSKSKILKIQQVEITYYWVCASRTEFGVTEPPLRGNRRLAPR